MSFDVKLNHGQKLETRLGVRDGTKNIFPFKQAIKRRNIIMGEREINN
jgi:hypothetical protein